MVACRFDELTANTPRNRFVRSALERLAHIVGRPELAHRCRTLAVMLRQLGVTGAKPERREVSTDRFGRHDAGDQTMVAAAHLAFSLAVPAEEQGMELLPLPGREEGWARHLFEKAVAGFYNVVISPNGWRVDPGKRLAWPVAGQTAGIDSILPGMETDIVLYPPDRDGCIVIDTKFTAIVKHNQYEKKKLESRYLYQIYAYLRSQESTAQVSRPMWGQGYRSAPASSHRYQGG